LHDPALGDLQMPPVDLLVADCGHDPRRLPGFDDDDNLVRFGVSEIGLDKFVAPALWRLDDRRVPFLGLALHPGLELFGGVAQHIATDRIELPVAAKEPDHPLGLLERLDQAVDEDPVETAIAKPDAVFVVCVKCVHHRLPYFRAGNITLPSQPVPANRGISRAKPLAR
jgi:hypothetical protein